MKKCCVLGLGYIGLPTSALLSNNGFNVVGVDVKKEIIISLKKGVIHFTEPELERLINISLETSTFKPTQFPEKSDVFLVAVPTPLNKDSSKTPKPDIQFVFEAIKSIKNFLKKGDLIVIESTCPVGTTEEIKNYLINNTNLSIEEFYLAYCPERVLPGNIIYELIHNERVIGGINPNSTEKAKSFYSTFCKGKLHLTNARTAELVKLSENAFRDVNIAFANEISIIASELDINPYKLIELANHHPRVNILNPSCGVGGHCIAVDPWFIVSSNPSSSKLISTARTVNDGKSIWSINKIIEKVKVMEFNLKRKVNIGCLGITFKPNVEDLRESPALYIVNNLINRGYELLVCDPNINGKYFKTFELCELDFALDNADLIVTLVGHKEFLNMNLKNKEFLDLCGII